MIADGLFCDETVGLSLHNFDPEPAEAELVASRMCPSTAWPEQTQLLSSSAALLQNFPGGNLILWSFTIYKGMF